MPAFPHRNAGYFKNDVTKLKFVRLYSRGYRFRELLFFMYYAKQGILLNINHQ